MLYNKQINITMLKIENLIDIYNLQENYKNDNKNKQKVIFVSIGSAAHMRKTIEYISHLDTQYNQQCPEWINRLIRDKYNDNKITEKFLDIDIILMDESLEKPPYCARHNECAMKCHTDYNKYINGEITIDTECEIELCIYHKCYDTLSNYEINDEYNNIYVSDNEKHKITVYSFNDNITYPGDEYNDYEKVKKENDLHDISPFMRRMNELAIKNNWFMVFHDFTGRNAIIFMQLMDREIENHYNHVIYGLGLRCDTGCYIDLTDITCDFVYYDNEYMSAYNPYGMKTYIEMNKMIENNFTEKKRKIAELYRDICINNMKYNFNDLINKFRRLALHIMDADINITDNEIAYMYYIHDIDIINIFSDDDMEDKINVMIITEIKYIMRMTQNISEEEINEKTNNCIRMILSENDPYKYSAIIKYCCNI